MPPACWASSILGSSITIVCIRTRHSATARRASSAKNGWRRRPTTRSALCADRMKAQRPRMGSGQARQPRAARRHEVSGLTRAQPWTNPKNQALSGYSGATTLTDDQDAVDVLRACAVDLDQLRRDVLGYVDNELTNLVTKTKEEAKPTASFQRILQRAAIHVQSSGREEVTGANVLVAMFAERESHAVYYLQEQDMTRFDAVNYISHGIAKVPSPSETNRIHGAILSNAALVLEPSAPPSI